MGIEKKVEENKLEAENYTLGDEGDEGGQTQSGLGRGRNVIVKGNHKAH